MFKLTSPYSPTGDQPQAIAKLTQGVEAGLKDQVLIGVTGSGKTYTMASVIQRLQMPALVISHNKTLAGQLYQEMRDFFPHNAVSYFVSYYDYYQPEAYIPQTDTYIEKEAQINETIDKLRLASTANILTRPDAIVVASVSCIYNIGSPEEYGRFTMDLSVGQKHTWNEISRRLIELLYSRSEFEFKRGTFRIRGEHLDIYPAYDDFGVRVTAMNGTITSIDMFDPLTGKKLERPETGTYTVFPAKHYLTDPKVFASVEHNIRNDMTREVALLQKAGKIVEAQRLQRRTNYDLEMIKEVGYVNGIENYSRYLDGRKKGDPPYSLLDYFRLAYKNKFLVFIDESHMTVPQIRGMFNGDYARKKVLIDFGFRLNAAYDNRPLTFDEFYKLPPHIIYVSATPNEWETELAKREAGEKDLGYDGTVEQLIRPTGIVDPKITVRPAQDEIQDLIKEIEARVEKKQKILVTTLTKKTAEDLTEFLKEKNVKAQYLHSDVQTLERSNVLENLRRGEYDVLIGVNLLREGLDLPEVYLVAILDADREGFLRSRTSLIQTMGRAARNVDGEVIMYADVVTKSMEAAISEINRRREYQIAYNKRHNIVPKTILKPVRERIAEEESEFFITDNKNLTYGPETVKKIDVAALTSYDKKKTIKKLEREMKKMAEQMNFELAIALRDKIAELKS